MAFRDWFLGERLMLASPPFLFDIFVPPPLTVPDAIADAEWSLSQVTTAPAQIPASEWSLEDTP